MSPFKSIGAIAAGAAKFEIVDDSEVVLNEMASDPVLTDAFDYAEDGVVEPQQPTDPLAILNQLVQSGGNFSALDSGKVAPGIPSASTIIATYGKENPKAVTKPGFYDMLLTQYNSLSDYIDAEIKIAKASGDKLYYTSLIKAKTQIPKEIAAVENQKKGLSKIFAAELDAFHDLGKKLAAGEVETISLEMMDAVDLDGNGYIGDPSASNIAVGQAKDEEDNVVYSFIEADTQKPITQFDPETGEPLDTSTVESTYAFDLAASSSLTLVDPDLKTGDEDFALQIKSTSGTHAANPLGLPLGINIPEYILVQTDEEGEPLTDESGEMIPVPFVEKGGTVQQIPEGNCKKIWIEEVTVTTVKPVHAGTDKNWDHKIDGGDIMVEFYAHDNPLKVASFRIKGKFDSTSPFSHKGYVAASSMGLAINANSREHGVKIDGSGYISTGTVAISKDEEHALYNEFGIAINATFDEAEDLHIAELMSRWTNMEEGWTDQEGLKTGLVIKAKAGIITGDKANTLLIQDEFIDDPTCENGDAKLVANMGKGLNAFFGHGNSDHVIQQVTVAKITGGSKNSENLISTQDQEIIGWNAGDYIEVLAEGKVDIARAGLDHDGEGNDFYDAPYAEDGPAFGDVSDPDLTTGKPTVNEDSPSTWNGETETSAEGVSGMATEVIGEIQTSWKELMEAPEDPYLNYDWEIRLEDGELLKGAEQFVSDFFAGVNDLGIGDSSYEDESMIADPPTPEGDLTELDDEGDHE